MCLGRKCALYGKREPESFSGYANVVDIPREKKNDEIKMRFLLCWPSHLRDIRLNSVMIDHKSNNVTTAPLFVTSRR